MNANANANAIVRAAYNTARTDHVRDLISSIWYADEYASRKENIPGIGIVVGYWHAHGTDTTMPRLAKLLSRAGYNIEWQDEFAACDVCCKANRSKSRLTLILGYQYIRYISRHHNHNQKDDV